MKLLQFGLLSLLLSSVGAKKSTAPAHKAKKAPAAKAPAPEAPKAPASEAPKAPASEAPKAPAFAVKPLPLRAVPRVTKVPELPPATYSVNDSLVYCESIYETFDTSDMFSGDIFVEVVFKEIDTVHFSSFDLCRKRENDTLEYHGTISENIPILGVLTNEKHQWRLLANPRKINPSIPCSGIDVIASTAFSFYFNTSTTVNDPLDFSIGYMIDQCIRSTAE
jgi:hypothetical protein